MKGKGLMDIMSDMRQTADEFIREECQSDAWCEDTEIVGYCEACHGAIRHGEYAMSIVMPGIKRRAVQYTFCESCLDELSFAELLDNMGVDYRRGFAEDAIPDTKEAVRRHNAREKAVWRKTITTAAKMKEARA